jgi:hypothetical protein
MARLAPLAWLVCLSFVGCVRADRRPRFHANYEHQAHCARPIMPNGSPYRLPLAEPLRDPSALALLDAELPNEARRAARAADLEPLIVSLLRRQRSGDTSSSEYLSEREELTLRIIAFDAQMVSLAFEVACTRRRIDDLLATLDAQERRRQRGLAAGSLVVGASTGTISGGWGLAGSNAVFAPALVAVAGGLITTALGAAALLVPERSVLLEHHHNLLRPVLEGDDPEHLFPSFIFRMISARYPGDVMTPRELLLAHVDSLVTEVVPRRERDHTWRVLGSDGGMYSRRQLEARAGCFHLLEQAVGGVARQLELLDRRLVRLFAWQAH